LTSLRRAPYHSRSTAPYTEHTGGMADHTDNQQPTDPLTVGELISLAEAAEYASLTKGSLLDYIRRGRLKAKKIGNIWVTTQAAIDEYLNSRDFESMPKKYRNRP
jgi:hypothetical protein